MNDWAETVVTRDDPALTAPFVTEMLRQIRAVDRYGIWDGAGDHEVLDPFVMTKQRMREIPVVGDPDEETIARVTAWYNALSAMIEARTGRMAVPFISIHYEGFGRALIAVGRLIVADRTLRDIHRFGFKSLADMANEAERIVDASARLIQDHPDVADL